LALRGGGDGEGIGTVYYYTTHGSKVGKRRKREQGTQEGKGGRTDGGREEHPSPLLEVGRSELLGSRHEYSSTVPWSPGGIEYLVMRQLLHHHLTISTGELDLEMVGQSDIISGTLPHPPCSRHKLQRVVILGARFKYFNLDGRGESGRRRRRRRRRKGGGNEGEYLHGKHVWLVY